MEKRNHLRIYDLLWRLGHTGTEDEIADRILAAPRAAVRADTIAEQCPCSAPRGSTEWRENRAQVVSVIVSNITRVGRVACIMPEAVCEPDGEGRDECPDEDAISETVAQVVAAVRNCDWQGRIDVVEDILSYMGSDVGEEVAAVKELLEDESEDVRVHAFYALCHLGADAEDVVPTLTEHLRGADVSLRDMALQAFYNCRKYVNATLVPDFLEVLTDPISDHDFRGLAAGCLWFCGADAEPAVPALTRGLTDDDYSVRFHSALALGAIGPAAKEALPVLLEARWSDIHQDVVHALRRIGAAAEEIAPVLVRMSQSEHNNDRRFAAKALVEIGVETDVAVAVLIDDLNGDDSLVRSLAADTLGGIGPRAESAVPALTTALNDEKRRVRDAAKAALEKIVPVAAV